jgi:uncharacterized protein with ACT and thioredoxin-like domain
MNLDEIIQKASLLPQIEGYLFIDKNIDKEKKFTVKSNGRTLIYVGLTDYENTKRIVMKRKSTDSNFRITSHKFFKRIKGKTWTQLEVYKRKKLIL